MPAVTGDPWTWPETAARHGRVDENDLRECKRLVQCADGDFLANIIGSLAENCLPNVMDFSRRIFQYDAQFPGQEAVCSSRMNLW